VHATEDLLASPPTSRAVVYTALAANVFIAVSKAIAAAWTGSTAMLSEAVHSFVDSGNEVLLLYGAHRARRPPDAQHPFGHGRELYFWSFVVALLIFALGSGVAILKGIADVRHPSPISDPVVSYVVLALAFAFEGVSFVVSLRKVSATKGDLGLYEAFRRSKDPPTFMVLFEDSAALVGIVIAACGTYASTSLGMPAADGVASILVGVVLAAISLVLARESKSLLIGEQADRVLEASVRRVAESAGRRSKVNGLLTAQLAPDQIVAALSLEFADELRAFEIEQDVIDIERAIRAAHPTVIMVFIKPQTDRTFRLAVQRRLGENAD
jgi:cation diffusion facilitator family transporter